MPKRAESALRSGELRRGFLATVLACLVAAPARAQTPPRAGPLRRAQLHAALPLATQTELAGKSLGGYPYFEYTTSFHEGDAVEVALDTKRFPEFAGAPCDLYVTAAKTDAQWTADPKLVDAAGGPHAIALTGATIEANSFFADFGTLSGAAGIRLGTGYDVVLDADRDGFLSDGDAIDGLGPDAGFYIVRDTTEVGPLEVVEILYSGGPFLGQDTYFPRLIGSMGELPLVVVSHGNGHNFQWYDHIGYHLASWGFVVMSHENLTGPGIETASTTTLTNTDYLLANQGAIFGGVLDGHIDSHRIVWIGHSRGGEGVVRAYTRLRTGNFVSEQYSADDIVLVSSIAPVTFLTPSESDPAEVNYHLIYGASDSDVTGSPASNVPKPFALYERARGNRYSTYIQGVGHAWFHDHGGNCFCSGPSLLNETITHQILLGYYLPLVKLHTEGSPAASDFLTRMYEDFHPKGIDPAAIVACEHRQALSRGNFVIDDYQSLPALYISSSGGNIWTNKLYTSLAEGLFIDGDGSFAFFAGTPFNGMTRFSSQGDMARGAVLDFKPGRPGYYELEVIPPERDLTDDEFLSFRACQGTRHPDTDAWNAPISFAVSLLDTSGNASTIDFGVYGGLTRPYLRAGFGPGAGWANEFSTVRLRLTDFLNNDSGLDLSNIRAVRFDFGPGFGSPRGRIAFDDIEITKR